MEIINLAAILITVAALFSFINYRFIGLPTTIGIMLLGLVTSLLIVVSGELGFSWLYDKANNIINKIDFDDTLMHGMLSFLLFAGALHVNLKDLKQQKYIIFSLATVGIIGSTFIIGILTFYLSQWIGNPISFMYCLLFGAIISPTDPIAVLSILKKVGINKSLETKITGESLFNDGVGIVVFLVLLGIATNTTTPSFSSISLLFLQEAVGGIIFGLAIGFIGYQLLKNVDHYSVEVLITLAMVVGGYALATQLHLSGPIAMVVAGLMIGNHGRQQAMSESTVKHLDSFWELLDEILNAVLFLLIGLELLIIELNLNSLVISALVIPIVLLARFLCISGSITLLNQFRTFSPHVIKIMTWAGLRGGISVALALSIPAGDERSILLTMTYSVVLFSIIIQGLTIEKYIKKINSE